MTEGSIEEVADHRPGQGRRTDHRQDKSTPLRPPSTSRKSTPREDEQHYRKLFEAMAEGFALHEVLCDAEGRPCDYRFIEVNPAFERQTGLDAANLVGRTVREVMPDIEPKWIERYGRVALTGEPEQFESLSEMLGRDFEVRAYQAGPGRLATVFTDITDRRQAAESLRQANEELQAQHEELRQTEQALLRLNEELEQRVQTRTVELEVANARLRTEITERKQAEEALRTSTLFPKQNPFPVLRVGSDGTLLYANSGAATLLDTWNCRVGRAVPDQVHEAVEQALRTGDPGEIEVPCGPILYSVAIAPIQAEGYANLYGYDITERIAAQKALAEREQRLRAALEGGQMGLWEWDIEKDVAVWDERACELLGADIQNRASSETFLGHVHCDDRDPLQARLAEALAAGGDFGAEFRIVHPNGETIWLTSRGTIVRDEQGRGVRMLGILFDVTQRKHMEEALRRMNDELEEEVQAQTEELQNAIAQLQEEVARRRLAEKDLQKRSRLLAGFFRHTITPLAFMDREFNFVQVNDAYAKVDDRQPDYFVGKNHFAVYPNAQNQVIFEEVVRTKQLYHALAKSFAYAEHPERTISYWNWQLTPLLDETGEVQYLVLNLQDVTERQQAMEELKTRTSQLQRLAAELSEAEDRERHRLAELLHDDLQQLLVGSKLRLNMIARRVKETPDIHTLVEETTALIAESIEKSRGLSHELSPPVLHHGDFGEVLQWLAEQIRATCGLKVRLRIGDDTDVRSQALKTFIYKAAREMLFNVVKHANVKRAAIVVQKRNGSIYLTVCDRGRGFDPQCLDVASQNGFGLFHIRERLQLLGGAMTVRSAPGRGSRFVLTIPMETADDTTDRENGTAVSPLSPRPVMQRKVNGAAKHKIRILLVDDHKVMRDGLAALLGEEPDIEVVGQAGNGRDAITLTAQLKPDVVVMDVVMPIINGEEATRQIKERWPGVRIVALSMLEEDATRERMLGAGAEAFLSKAGPSEVIAAAIRQQS